MQVFQLWFIALHQDLLADAPECVTVANEGFPDIRGMPRATQKQVALRLVKDFANDPALLADPRTEPAILPLD